MGSGGGCSGSSVGGDKNGGHNDLHASGRALRHEVPN